MYFCSPIERTDIQMMEETTCKPDYSNSMAEHLGIRFLPSTEDAVHAEMPVDHRTSQPFGMLNGGASLALAEIVAGHGSMSLCREGEYACGVQVSGNHLSAVPVRQSIRYRQTDSPRQILAYMEYHHSTRTTGFYCSCR